jgi:hypothetical protein
MSPEDRAEYGSVGGHTSWANTPDKRVRLAPAVAASPAELAWHAAKLGIDPENMTDEERERCQHARIAYFKRIALKSKQARAQRAREAAEQARFEQMLQDEANAEAAAREALQAAQDAAVARAAGITPADDTPKSA